MSANSALHRGLVDPDGLPRGLEKLVNWRGARKVQIVVRLADGRVESVGESRSLYLFWTQGLPMPELQYRVYDERGCLLGIVDFAWPEHRLFGEFDGKIKYGRLLGIAA